MATTYPPQNQWLLAEDEALKALISQIQVPNEQGVLKPVPVWFRFPESERAIIYPFVTLDLIGIEPAYDLWTSIYMMDEHEVEFEDDFGAPHHTGLYEPSVTDDIFTLGLDTSKPLRRMNYLQYRLFYQITTWSKTFAHDRIMTGAMIRDIIQPRPSWLRVDADDTWRRIEPLGWASSDMPIQEGGIKRIFRKAFTISVQSEIPQDQLPRLEQRAAVQKIVLRGQFIDTGEYWTRDESTDYWEQIQP